MVVRLALLSKRPGRSPVVSKLVEGILSRNMSDSKTTPITGGASEPRPVVIDADPGVDDVQAIAIALSADRRGEIRVLGITVTTGNSPLKQCIRNTRRALAIFDRLDIPIYAGAHCSLVNAAMGPTDLCHGNNGLGNVHFEDPLPEVKQQKEHAVSALVRLAREHKGKLCVLALAPLTNIAMAIRMDQSFIHNIADIYIMGGNYTGMGNTTPSGEFNFYTDPEAAYIVLSSVPRPVTIACWELCLNHGIDMDWRQKVLGATDSAAARFFNATEASSLTRGAFSRNWVSCDPVAAALLVRPQVALQTNTHHATVELQGEYTRGQMVVDRRGLHVPIPPRLSVNIVESLDMELYQKMLLDAFGHPDIAF